MPAVSLLEERISGIEPIFVTWYERLQLKHPISSIHRLKRRGRSAPGGVRQACRQDIDETIRSGYEFADRPQTGSGKAKQLSLTGTHEAYMRRAIALARIALVNGDTPVGSLVIHKRKIIAEGFEAVHMQVDVSGHAELIAIRNACS